MEIIKPAQVAYIAIYNPSLGQSDETLHEQVVYYYSTKFRESRKASSTSSEEQAREEGNEKLRQIGLAQGLVEFAKAFSDGAPVDAVDSEKSRILMRELEQGWWILASINLTQIQTKSSPSKSKQQESTGGPKIEYSAREVCPQTLLLQHLLKAHSVFLLHHAPSLADLYVRLTRPKFCAALERFWNRFVKDWDVLLHGTPAIDVYDGLKLAAGGELGVGVGEEEWGSGEREVLEGFVHRTEGLVDLVVSRFGDLEQDASPKLPSEVEQSPWLGSGNLPSSADGVMFSGVNAVTRPSMSATAKWMEWIFRSGQAAYGVQDNPHAPKRKRRRKQALSGSGEGKHANLQSLMSSSSQEPNFEDLPPGVPPPIVSAANRSLDKALKKAEQDQRRETESLAANKESGAGTEALMKYMTFGLYGSGWGLPNSRSDDQDKKPDEGEESIAQRDPSKAVKPPTSTGGDLGVASLNRRVQEGCFLVGLKGDLDDEGETDGEDMTDSGAEPEANASKAWNNRILLRTLHIERRQQLGKDDRAQQVKSEETLGARLGQLQTEASTATELSATEYFDRVQVVVYVRRPFIFTFLFELQTPTLNYTSFYRSIHHQLGPLQRPLLRSTSPTNVFSRLYDAVSPRTVTPVDSKQPIYDLVYDPSNLTVHTTIPSIPEAGDVTLGKDDVLLWSRLDALNVHSQIVSTYNATRRSVSELERTAKTSRGWWVVWIRLPSGQSNLFREAFLVRKASDYVDENERKTSFGFGRDVGLGWGSSTGKLAEGIGIDTRRYIEGLLSLNR